MPTPSNPLVYMQTFSCQTFYSPRLCAFSVKFSRVNHCTHGLTIHVIVVYGSSCQVPPFIGSGLVIASGLLETSVYHGPPSIQGSRNAGSGAPGSVHNQTSYNIHASGV